MRGEGPVRRLPKKYNIKLTPKSPFLWSWLRLWHSTSNKHLNLRSADGWISKKRDYIFWQQAWYRHFSSFQTFIYNLEFLLPAKKFQQTPAQWKQPLPSLVPDVLKKQHKSALRWMGATVTTLTWPGARSAYEIMPITKPLLHSLWNPA